MQKPDLDHYLNLTDRANRDRIRGLRPGGSVRVVVLSSQRRGEPPIDAKGTRSSDGKQLEVQVRTADDVYVHTRDWHEVLFDIDSIEKNG
jgi:hypothetical protein